jgi:hypothetical protein
LDSTVIAAVIGVGGVVLTIVGTLGGTYLGSALNRRSALRTAVDLAALEQQRYAQDRLWDARRESYTSIIAGLRAADKLAKAVDEGYNSGEIHPEEYHASGGSTKQINELWTRWRETRAEFEDARLLLSDTFVERFERIQTDLDGIDEDDIPPTVYARCAEILHEAIPALLTIAKAEIAPAPIHHGGG